MTTWQDITDERERYQAYLCSPEWGQLRRLVMDRCRGRCERCRLNAATAVHHLTYARKYRERLEDLIGICEGCHSFTHDPARARGAVLRQELQTCRDHRRAVEILAEIMEEKSWQKLG